MNFHNEIRRIKQTYTDPATKACATDCLNVFKEFAEFAVDTMDKLTSTNKIKESK